MAQRVYATTSDFENLAEEPFDGDDKKLGKRLRAASIEVEAQVRTAIYDVDEDGYPTNPDISDAFTEATVAIVEFWEITNDPTGAEARAGAVKIGTVSLGTTSSRESDDGDKLAARIGEKAATVLRNAGLTSQPGY